MRITDLPGEVLNIISSKLPLKDEVNLRMASKEIGALLAEFDLTPALMLSKIEQKLAFIEKWAGSEYNAETHEIAIRTENDEMTSSQLRKNPGTKRTVIDTITIHHSDYSRHRSVLTFRYDQEDRPIGISLLANITHGPVNAYNTPFAKRQSRPLPKNNKKFVIDLIIQAFAFYLWIYKYMKFHKGIVMRRRPRWTTLLRLLQIEFNPMDLGKYKNNKGSVTASSRSQKASQMISPELRMYENGRSLPLVFHDRRHYPEQRHSFSRSSGDLPEPRR